MTIPLYRGTGSREDGFNASTFLQAAHDLDESFGTVSISTGTHSVSACLVQSLPATCTQYEQANFVPARATGRHKHYTPWAVQYVDSYGDSVPVAELLGYRSHSIVIVEVEPSIVGRHIKQMHCVAEQIKHVRESLQPSVSELQLLFDVSTRQAIYNWLSGGSMSESKQMVLTQTVEAAVTLLAAGYAGNRNLLKIKYGNGKTLFEHLRDGEAGGDTARYLISILERQSAERAAVSKLLAGRKRKAADYNSIGRPMLDEDA